MGGKPMDTQRYQEVTVSYKGGEVICEPEWVRTFWATGPAEIRWKFVDVPSEVESVVVEFHDSVPVKYRHKQVQFRKKASFRGMGFAPTSANSHLPDLVTHGNNFEGTYYTYTIKLLDKDGNVIAENDPGNINDPNPPGSPLPPP